MVGGPLRSVARRLPNDGIEMCINSLVSTGRVASMAAGKDPQAARTHRDAASNLGEYRISGFRWLSENRRPWISHVNERVITRLAKPAPSPSRDNSWRPG